MEAEIPVIIEIGPGPFPAVRLLAYRELSSGNRLVARGISVLRQHAPRALRYLSLQRLLGRLPDQPIRVRSGGRDLAETRRVLKNWMERKRNRRLFYVIVEALLMPFTAFVAILPGPNVLFYGLFVLFYFHLKAFLSLSKVKVEELNITLAQS